MTSILELTDDLYDFKNVEKKKRIEENALGSFVNRHNEANLKKLIEKQDEENHK